MNQVLYETAGTNCLYIPAYETGRLDHSEFDDEANDEVSQYQMETLSAAMKRFGESFHSPYTNVTPLRSI